jgi:ABC-type transport system substrate-binding protein
LLGCARILPEIRRQVLTRRAKRLFIGLLFVAGAPVAIGLADASTPVKRQHDVIVGSLNGAPASLDPARIVESSQWHALENMGVTLVTHDREGRLVGEAARTWRVSDRFRRYSFTLARGIRDSKGRELDSSDWRATFLHLLRSGGSTHSFVAQFLDPAGIQTPSPLQLIIRLKRPYQTFLERLTTPEFILVPKESIAHDNTVHLGVSSGAYRLKDIDSVEGTCTLLANPYSARFRPGQINEVILKSPPSSNLKLFQLLETGKWNFALASLLPTSPGSRTLSQTLSDGKVVAETTRPSASGFIVTYGGGRLRTIAQKLAFAKVIGRQADRDMNGLSATVTHQIYPPGFVGAIPPPAERALFEGIMKRGSAKDLPKRLIGYGTVQSFQVGLAQWVKRTLSRHGVRVEIREMPYPEYHAKYRSLDRDFFIGLTGLNAKDPAGSLLTMVSPKGGIIPDPGGTLTGLLKRAVEASPARRAALLHRLSMIMLSEARFIPIVLYGTSVVSSPNVVVAPSSEYDDDIRLADIRWRR